MSGNLLKVKGEAVVYRIPEIMVVYIPIQSKSVSYERCSDQLFDNFNALKKALTKSGIDEELIHSSHLRIRENFKYVDRKRKPDGYIGNIQVKMELEHSQKVLKKIINTLNDDRFNYGYSLSFKLSEQQKNNSLKEAIQVAVKDARKKAEIIAEALNTRLGEVADVNYEYGTNGQPPMFRGEQMMAYDAKGSANEVNLNPEEMKIMKTIKIIWKIEQ